MCQTFSWKVHESVASSLASHFPVSPLSSTVGYPEYENLKLALSNEGQLTKLRGERSLGRTGMVARRKSTRREEEEQSASQRVQEGSLGGDDGVGKRKREDWRSTKMEIQ